MAIEADLEVFKYGGTDALIAVIVRRQGQVLGWGTAKTEDLDRFIEPIAHTLKCSEEEVMQRIQEMGPPVEHTLAMAMHRMEGAPYDRRFHLEKRRGKRRILLAG